MVASVEKGRAPRGEPPGQTGPMCVCSAVENNVHWEALMRFKNNGDYLYYIRYNSRRRALLHRCYTVAIYQSSSNSTFLVLRLAAPSRVMRDTQTRIPHRGLGSAELLAAKQCRGRKLIIPLLQSPPPPPAPRNPSGFAFLARWRLSRRLGT